MLLGERGAWKGERKTRKCKIHESLPLFARDANLFARHSGWIINVRLSIVPTNKEDLLNNLNDFVAEQKPARNPRRYANNPKSGENPSKDYSHRRFRKQLSVLWFLETKEALRLSYAFSGGGFRPCDGCLLTVNYAIVWDTFHTKKSVT